MPKISIDEFDESPKTGDKVKVMGVVKFIDEDSGEVEVSYDDVKIVKKDKKQDRSDDDNDEIEISMEEEVEPESQSLDAALSRSFPNTQ